jgi:hypothetical protein
MDHRGPYLFSPCQEVNWHNTPICAVLNWFSSFDLYTRGKVSKTIDLELTRAEVEVLELEARLRVVPMNDTQLSDALKTALAAKKERLAKLRTLHATAGRGKGKDGEEKVNPLHAGRRPPLKRTVPQRPQAKSGR